MSTQLNANNAAAVAAALLCGLLGFAPPPAAAQVTGHELRRGAIKSYPHSPTPAPPADAPETAEKDYIGTVERGSIDLTIHTQGTVRAEKIFRMRSTIEGRVEDVFAKPRVWFPAHKELATVLSKELAAIIDAKSATPAAVMHDRWNGVYKPTPISCPFECYVLKTFARSKKWVEPGALLLEAAQKLRLIGRIPPGSGRFIDEDQILTFWDVKNPNKKLQAKVDDFILDIQGKKVQSAGTFTILLDSRNYLDPGTQWEGTIKPRAKKDVLRVPTSAIIVVDDQAYLPVRISTGITTGEYTEVTAGVASKDQFLFLEKATDIRLQKHEPPPVMLKAPPTPRYRTPRRRAPRRREERRRQEERQPVRRSRAQESPIIDFYPVDDEDLDEEPGVVEMTPEEKKDEEIFPSDFQP